MIEIVIARSKERRGRTIFIETWASTDEDAIRMADKISSLPKVIETSSNNFEIPYRYFNNVLDALDEWELHIFGELDKDIQNYINSRNEIASSSNDQFSFKTVPFAHQVECFEYAKDHPCFLLGDEQGLGKTKQAIDIAVSRKSSFKHCLIVCCISGLKWNWAKEVGVHSNESAHILGSRVTKDGKLVIDGVSKRADDLLTDRDEFFLITNVETLRDAVFIKYLNELTKSGEIGMVIIDEIHKCKNPSSKQGASIQKLQSYYKMGLTGTPLMNNPIDLFNVMKWLGAEHHTLTQFKERYCIVDQFNQITGYRNLNELRDSVNEYMLRRTKEEVLDLPEKIRVTEYVDMNSKQSKIYKEVLTKLVEEIDKVKLMPNPLAETIRLRQATGNPSILTTQDVKSSKFERCIELVEECIQQEKSCVIFSNWEKVIEPLTQFLSKKVKCNLVTGATEDKFKEIEDFMNYEKPSVILGTIGALGTGFTLTKADTVIFLDSPWTRAEKDQAEDRCHRIGAKNTVTIYTLVAKGTVDERIEDLIESKGELADYIVDGKPMKSKIGNLFDILLK